MLTAEIADHRDGRPLRVGTKRACHRSAEQRDAHPQANQFSWCPVPRLCVRFGSVASDRHLGDKKHRYSITSSALARKDLNM
jgi:hypothetical protein